MILIRVNLTVLLIVLMLFSKFANGAMQSNDCPIKKVTTAYLDYQQAKTKEIKLGEMFEDFMNKIHALKKSDHFKGVDLVSQSIDVQPNYNSNEMTRVAIRVTIEFELNYQAISQLYRNFPSTTLHVSSYDMARCKK